MLVAAPFFVAQGQSTAETTAGASSGASTRRPEPKVLRLEDFAQWNRITSPALSPDGKWMTFTYSPNEGGQTILHVKALDGGKDYTASVGNAAGGGRAGGAPGGRGGGGGGNAPSFSSDSRWAAYMVTPEGRGGAGRGGAGRGRGGQQATAPQEAPTVAHLELLNLASGEKVSIPNAASWKFSSDAHWLAVKLNRAPGAPPRPPLHRRARTSSCAT